MFDKHFEERLVLWREFRNELETSSNPIQDTIDFYNQVPITGLAADPYTPSTWPDPWELLEENIYCPFVKILAICYTLQLTDVLSQAEYVIHTAYDNKKSETYYLLQVNNQIIGYLNERSVPKHELPSTFQSHFEYQMPPIQ
jgi:hypothetical protein